MAEDDAGVAVEPTTEAPSESVPEMGMGIAEDKAPGEGGSDASAQSNEVAEGSTPAESTDKQTVESQDERDGKLRHARFTQRMQELSEKDRDLNAREQEFLREKQEWINQQQAALQPQVQQPATLSQQIRSMVQSTPAWSESSPDGLSANDRQGLELVAGIAEVNEYLTQKVDTLEQQLASIQPTVDQTAQTVTSMSQGQADELKKRAQTEQADAVNLFGQEAVDAHWGYVQNNWGREVDPVTGDLLTIPELIAIRTQSNFEQAQAAKEANRAAANGAKTRVRPQGTSSAPSGPQGYLTRDQAIAQIAATS